jgi:hypothetical protein
MIPNGPTPKPAFTRGFFKVAEAQNPKPETIALAYADAEFGQNACEGARENAKDAGFKIVYDKSYPPSTIDFTPIVRAIRARNPDLLVICSYPLDTVGMIKTINEIGFKPKMWGGAMVGLQATAFKTQLGPLLYGVVNFETWLPVKSMEFPGSIELPRNISNPPLQDQWLRLDLLPSGNPLATSRMKRGPIQAPSPTLRRGGSEPRNRLCRTPIARSDQRQRLASFSALDGLLLLIGIEHTRPAELDAVGFGASPAFTRPGNN